MIIYNVTLNIDETIHDDWLIWIRKHITDVLNTQHFEHALLTQVQVKEQMGGITYSIQFTAKSEAHLKSYYTDFAPQLRKEGVNQFGSKMLVYRTELKVVDKFYHKQIKLVKLKTR